MFLVQVIHAGVVVTQQQDSAGGGGAGVQSQLPGQSSLCQIQNTGAQSSRKFTETLSTQRRGVWAGVDDNRMEHGGFSLSTLWINVH